MERRLEQSQAGTNEVLSKLSPEKLLLLGIQLLSKNNGSKPPSPPVVQPRLQSKSETAPGSPPSPDSHQNTPPSSPEQLQQVPKANNGRKRKRGENSQLSNNEKREKRKLMNRVAAQNARDRKKNYVLDLERRLAELEAKNEELQLDNKSLREKTDALAAENHQLEKQLFHQKPHTPSILGCQFDSTLEDKENLSESGSAVPSSSLQQKQILEALLAQVLMTFDSLAHLLQEYWPECDVTDSGSHDPVANVRCQSHDLEQGVLLPSLETSVVGDKTVHVEPLSELNALLGPSDPLATTTAVCDESFCNPIPIVPNFTAPLSDFPPPNFTAPCPPTDPTNYTGNDFSDFELEKLFCPFTASDRDLNYFDLESLIDA